VARDADPDEQRPRTRIYVERRTAEGKTELEIMSILKRDVAREVCPLLPRSSSVSSALRPNPRSIIEQMIELGLTRIVFGLPPARADTVLRLLDSYAVLGQAVQLNLRQRPRHDLEPPTTTLSARRSRR
jgi:hypothetical protein